jgi:ligand-binding sensor domain-containing protein
MVSTVKTLLRVPLLFFTLFMLALSCEKDETALDPGYKTGSWVYFDKTSGLTNDSVMEIYADSKGYIWIATYGGGVCRYDNGNWAYWRKSNGLLSDRVYSIVEDADGDIWFSTFYGFSVLQAAGNIVNINKIGDDYIYGNKLYKDSRGWIWCADQFWGIYVYDNSNLGYYELEPVYPEVQCFAEDAYGKMYLGCETCVICYSNSEGFTIFNQQSELFKPNVSSIFFDSRNIGWFGHADAEKVTRIHDYKVDYINLYSGWNFTTVNSFLEDEKHDIWISLYPGGIKKFDGVEPETIGLKSGLTDDRIKCSTLDNYGNYWFGTRSKGICVYKPYD